MVHKTLQTSKPYYLNTRLNTDHDYRTRQQTGGCIRLDQTYKYTGDLPRKSFRCRGAHNYNAIPADLRNTSNLNTFKNKLKKWIKLNISPE